MGLQLFTDRTWEEDSFNETNVESVLRNAREMAGPRAVFGPYQHPTFSAWPLPGVEQKTSKEIK